VDLALAEVVGEISVHFYSFLLFKLNGLISEVGLEIRHCLYHALIQVQIKHQQSAIC
jgi:hypothetical protein